MNRSWTNHMHKLNNEGDYANEINFGSHTFFGLITFTGMIWTLKDVTISLLYYTLDLNLRITLKWIFILGLIHTISESPKIRKLWSSQIYEFIIFSYELWLKSLQLQSCNLQQDLSNTLSHAFIRSHLNLVFLILMVRIQIYDLIHGPSFNLNF